MSATAARPIVIVVSPRPAPAGVADVDPDAAPDGPSVLVTPPPSRIVRHLPPILRGNRALPVDPRDLYPLARKALRRYQHAIPEHEWDDLCQEIVLSAVSRGHRYDPSRGTVEQWISGVARNCVRYYLRGVSEAWPDLDLETVAAPEDELDRDRESLRQTLDAVPEPGRTIVERHVFEGRTFREIAEEMGLPVANVHRHYKATTTLLRARLREE